MPPQVCGMDDACGSWSDHAGFGPVVLTVLVIRAPILPEVGAPVMPGGASCAGTLLATCVKLEKVGARCVLSVVETE